MPNSVHREFLKLLDWEGERLEAFLPDWLRAAEYLELSDRDVEMAVNKWLPTYWDLSLAGIRKCIAACIIEVSELAKFGQYKAEGQKILYSNTTSSHVSVYANKLAGNGRLHVGYPEYLISKMYNAFFNKDLYHIAPEMKLNSTCSHCAMNCLRTAGGSSGRLVAPTAVWSWGLHCDECYKAVEMLNCMNGEIWNNVLLTIPHDAPEGCIEAEDESRVQYLALKIRNSQEELSQLTGIRVSEEHIRRAMDEYLAYMDRLETLTNLVVNADPQPISVNALTLFGICTQACLDTGLGYINDALDTMIEEVRERIAKNAGSLPKGAPKLACHFHAESVPWIDRAFRDNGVCLSIGRLFPTASIFRAALDDNIYVSVARHCLMCPNSVNMQDSAAIITKLLSKYKFDGALYGFYTFDRWIGALQKLQVSVMEESTGLPHFYLDGDFWDGSKYSIEDRLSIIRGICNCLKISGIS